MKKLLLTLAVLALLASAASACGIATGDIQATISAQVASTVAAQPPKEVQVTVEVPVEVPATVEVPVAVQVTVQVPVTVVVEATPVVGAADTQPAPAATNPPVVSTNAQDPLAGANPTPIIDEKFDFPNKYFWNLFGPDTGSSTGDGKIENEQFTIVVVEPEHVEWTFGGKKFGNFYLAGRTIVPNTTCKAGDHWGLIFRMKDNASFYMFGVSCDGKYRLMKRVDGVFENIVDFTDSDAIKDLGQRNVLGVRAVGSQISLYANDQFLGTVADGTFAEGVVGMYAASRLTPNLTVSFDDIAVYTIGQ